MLSEGETLLHRDRGDLNDAGLSSGGLAKSPKLYWSSMRYSLLNFVQCPVTQTELTCLVIKETEMPAAHVRLMDCQRINQPGAIFGPTPHFHRQTWLTEYLQSQACEPAPASRNYSVVVEEGLLISGETGRWYPIRNFIPELLPDHLRDIKRDLDYLKGFQNLLPPELFEKLNDAELFATNDSDIGLKHKRSEMAIATKVEDPSFFVPGFTSPFNPSASDHTIYLIRLFSFCLPLLFENGQNKIVLDAGCGYSWTTEWLYKIGFEPIGVDITRTYLEIAVNRLGAWLPHVMVADTENLPIKSEVLDAIFCYEAFHHIPDRNKAMKGFFRTLKPGKRVLLAEPGLEHEKAQVAIDVMQKYGILERGMDLAAIEGYTRGTDFLKPKRHNIVEVDDSVPRSALLADQNWQRYSFTNSNLFSLEKPVQRLPEPHEASPEPSGRMNVSVTDLWRRLQLRRRRHQVNN
jgi:SAM-dependent methyltransferase/uncharacterized protein YbaR (Trm112 family)